MVKTNNSLIGEKPTVASILWVMNGLDFHRTCSRPVTGLELGFTGLALCLSEIVCLCLWQTVCSDFGARLTGD